MEYFIARFKAPDWVDQELMQMRASAQIGPWEFLSQLQAPIAHHIADALRGRGLKVGEPKWIHFRHSTHADVEVEGKTLVLAVYWLRDGNKEEDENAWGVMLNAAYVPESPEQFLEPTQNRVQESVVLEKLHQIVNEVLQRAPRISHIEWEEM